MQYVFSVWLSVIEGKPNSVRYYNFISVIFGKNGPHTNTFSNRISKTIIKLERCSVGGVKMSSVRIIGLLFDRD